MKNNELSVNYSIQSKTGCMPSEIRDAEDTCICMFCILYHIYDVTIFLLIFWIKWYLHLYMYLTVYMYAATNRMVSPGSEIVFC